MIHRLLLKFKKLGNALAANLKNHPAWFLAGLISLLTLYAAVIFGAYAVNETLPASDVSNLQVNETLYQRVLQRLQARETNLQQGIGQNYPDIFR